MHKKAKILIIENADIIQQGLAYILTKKNKTELSLLQYDEESDLRSILISKTPQILIAPPAFLLKNSKLINIQKKSHGLKTIGLICAYHHPDTLANFNGLIYLDDKNQTITTIIDKLLLPAPSHDKRTTATSNDILSEREKEVLKLLAKGSSTKQIAEVLFISPHTVNAHRKNIMRKLDIKTIPGLTIYAVLNNIITLKDE